MEDVKLKRRRQNMNDISRAVCREIMHAVGEICGRYILSQTYTLFMITVISVIFGLRAEDIDAIKYLTGSFWCANIVFLIWMAGFAYDGE